jgi:hypothetical protein
MLTLDALIAGAAYKLAFLDARLLIFYAQYQV